MWNNSQWEQENQELLKEWYLDKVTGKAPDSAVRKIHCEGCGGIFYTRIHSKPNWASYPSLMGHRMPRTCLCP